MAENEDAQAPGNPEGDVGIDVLVELDIEESAESVAGRVDEIMRIANERIGGKRVRVLDQQQIQSLHTLVAAMQVMGGEGYGNFGEQFKQISSAFATHRGAIHEVARDFEMLAAATGRLKDFKVTLTAPISTLNRQAPTTTEPAKKASRRKTSGTTQTPAVPTEVTQAEEAIGRLNTLAVNLQDDAAYDKVTQALTKLGGAVEKISLDHVSQLADDFQLIGQVNFAGATEFLQKLFDTKGSMQSLTRGMQFFNQQIKALETMSVHSETGKTANPFLRLLWDMDQAMMTTAGNAARFTASIEGSMQKLKMPKLEAVELPAETIATINKLAEMGNAGAMLMQAANLQPAQAARETTSRPTNLPGAEPAPMNREDERRLRRQWNDKLEQAEREEKRGSRAERVGKEKPEVAPRANRKALDPDFNTKLSSMEQALSDGNVQGAVKALVEMKDSRGTKAREYAEQMLQSTAAKPGDEFKLGKIAKQDLRGAFNQLKSVHEELTAEYGGVINDKRGRVRKPFQLIDQLNQFQAEFLDVQQGFDAGMIGATEAQDALSGIFTALDKIRGDVHSSPTGKPSYDKRIKDAFGDIESSLVQAGKRVGSYSEASKPGDIKNLDQVKDVARKALMDLVAKGIVPESALSRVDIDTRLGANEYGYFNKDSGKIGIGAAAINEVMGNKNFSNAKHRDEAVQRFIQSNYLHEAAHSALSSLPAEERNTLLMSMLGKMGIGKPTKGKLSSSNEKVQSVISGMEERGYENQANFSFLNEIVSEVVGRVGSGIIKPSEIGFEMDAENPIVQMLALITESSKGLPGGIQWAANKRKKAAQSPSQPSLFDAIPESAFQEPVTPPEPSKGSRVTRGQKPNTQPAKAAKFDPTEAVKNTAPAPIGAPRTVEASSLAAKATLKDDKYEVEVLEQGQRPAQLKFSSASFKNKKAAEEHAKKLYAATLAAPIEDVYVKPEGVSRIEANQSTKDGQVVAWRVHVTEKDGTSYTANYDASIYTKEQAKASAARVYAQIMTKAETESRAAEGEKSASEQKLAQQMKKEKASEIEQKKSEAVTTEPAPTAEKGKSKSTPVGKQKPGTAPVATKPQEKTQPPRYVSEVEFKAKVDSGEAKLVAKSRTGDTQSEVYRVADDEHGDPQYITRHSKIKTRQITEQDATGKDVVREEKFAAVSYASATSHGEVKSNIGAEATRNLRAVEDPTTKPRARSGEDVGAIIGQARAEQKKLANEARTHLKIRPEMLRKEDLQELERGGHLDTLDASVDGRYFMYSGSLYKRQGDVAMRINNVDSEAALDKEFSGLSKEDAVKLKDKFREKSGRKVVSPGGFDSDKREAGYIVEANAIRERTGAIALPHPSVEAHRGKTIDIGVEKTADGGEAFTMIDNAAKGPAMINPLVRPADAVKLVAERTKFKSESKEAAHARTFSEFERLSREAATPEQRAMAGRVVSDYQDLKSSEKDKPKVEAEERRREAEKRLNVEMQKSVSTVDQLVAHLRLLAGLAKEAGFNSSGSFYKLQSYATTQGFYYDDRAEVRKPDGSYGYDRQALSFRHQNPAVKDRAIITMDEEGVAAQKKGTAAATDQVMLQYGKQAPAYSERAKLQEREFEKEIAIISRILETPFKKLQRARAALEKYDTLRDNRIFTSSRLAEKFGLEMDMDLGGYQEHEANENRSVAAYYDPSGTSGDKRLVKTYSEQGVAYQEMSRDKAQAFINTFLGRKAEEEKPKEKSLYTELPDALQRAEVRAQRSGTAIGKVVAYMAEMEKTSLSSAEKFNLLREAATRFGLAVEESAERVDVSGAVVGRAITLNDTTRTSGADKRLAVKFDRSADTLAYAAVDAGKARSDMEFFATGGVKPKKRTAEHAQESFFNDTLSHIFNYTNAIGDKRLDIFGRQGQFYAAERDTEGNFVKGHAIPTLEALVGILKRFQVTTQDATQALGLFDAIAEKAGLHGERVANDRYSVVSYEKDGKHIASVTDDQKRATEFKTFKDADELRAYKRKLGFGDLTAKDAAFYTQSGPQAPRFWATGRDTATGTERQFFQQGGSFFSADYDESTGEFKSGKLVNGIKEMAKLLQGLEFAGPDAGSQVFDMVHRMAGLRSMKTVPGLAREQKMGEREFVVGYEEPNYDLLNVLHAERERLDKSLTTEQGKLSSLQGRRAAIGTPSREIAGVESQLSTQRQTAIDLSREIEAQRSLKPDTTSIDTEIQDKTEKLESQRVYTAGLERQRDKFQRRIDAGDKKMSPAIISHVNEEIEKSRKEEQALEQSVSTLNVARNEEIAKATKAAEAIASLSEALEMVTAEIDALVQKKSKLEAGTAEAQRLDTEIAQQRRVIGGVSSEKAKIEELIQQAPTEARPIKKTETVVEDARSAQTFQAGGKFYTLTYDEQGEADLREHKDEKTARKHLETSGFLEQEAPKKPFDGGQVVFEAQSEDGRKGRRVHKKNGRLYAENYLIDDEGQETGHETERVRNASDLTRMMERGNFTATGDTGEIMRAFEESADTNDTAKRYQGTTGKGGGFQAYEHATSGTVFASFVENGRVMFRSFKDVNALNAFLKKSGGTVTQAFERQEYQGQDLLDRTGTPTTFPRLPGRIALPPGKGSTIWSPIGPPGGGNIPPGGTGGGTGGPAGPDGKGEPAPNQDGSRKAVFRMVDETNQTVLEFYRDVEGNLKALKYKLKSIDRRSGVVDVEGAAKDIGNIGTIHAFEEASKKHQFFNDDDARKAFLELHRSFTTGLPGSNIDELRADLNAAGPHPGAKRFENALGERQTPGRFIRDENGNLVEAIKLYKNLRGSEHEYTVAHMVDGQTRLRTYKDEIDALKHMRDLGMGLNHEDNRRVDSRMRKAERRTEASRERIMGGADPSGTIRATGGYKNRKIVWDDMLKTYVYEDEILQEHVDEQGHKTNQHFKGRVRMEEGGTLDWQNAFNADTLEKYYDIQHKGEVDNLEKLRAGEKIRSTIPGQLALIGKEILKWGIGYSAVFMAIDQIKKGIVGVTKAAAEFGQQQFDTAKRLSMMMPEQMGRGQMPYSQGTSFASADAMERAKTMMAEAQHIATETGNTPGDAQKNLAALMTTVQRSVGRERAPEAAMELMKLTGQYATMNNLDQKDVVAYVQSIAKSGNLKPEQIKRMMELDRETIEASGGSIDAQALMKARQATIGATMTAQIGQEQQSVILGAALQGASAEDAQNYAQDATTLIQALAPNMKGEQTSKALSSLYGEKAGNTFLASPQKNLATMARVVTDDIALRENGTAIERQDANTRLQKMAEGMGMEFERFVAIFENMNESAKTQGFEDYADMAEKRRKLKTGATIEERFDDLKGRDPAIRLRMVMAELAEFTDKIGKESWEGINKGLDAMLATIREINKNEVAIKGMGKAIGMMASVIMGFVSGVFGVVNKRIDVTFKGLNALSEALSSIKSPTDLLMGILNGIIHPIDTVVGGMAALAKGFSLVSSKVVQVGTALHNLAQDLGLVEKSAERRDKSSEDKLVEHAKSAAEIGMLALGLFQLKKMVQAFALAIPVAAQSIKAGGGILKGIGSVLWAPISAMLPRFMGGGFAANLFDAAKAAKMSGAAGGVAGAASGATGAAGVFSRLWSGVDGWVGATKSGPGLMAKIGAKLALFESAVASMITPIRHTATAFTNAWRSTAAIPSFVERLFSAINAAKFTKFGAAAAAGGAAGWSFATNAPLWAQMKTGFDAFKGSNVFSTFIKPMLDGITKGWSTVTSAVTSSKVFTAFTSKVAEVFSSLAKMPFFKTMADIFSRMGIEVKALGSAMGGGSLMAKAFGGAIRLLSGPVGLIISAIETAKNLFDLGKAGQELSQANTETNKSYDSNQQQGIKNADNFVNILKSEIAKEPEGTERSKKLKGLLIRAEGARDQLKSAPDASTHWNPLQRQADDELRQQTISGALDMVSGVQSQMSRDPKLAQQLRDTSFERSPGFGTKGITVRASGGRMSDVNELFYRGKDQGLVVTTQYGVKDGLHGQGHAGIDFAPNATAGKASVAQRTVFAQLGGTVESAGPMDGFGQAVVIMGKDGRRHIYGHLDPRIQVKQGQEVERGTPLAVMYQGPKRANDHSTGTHLDYRVQAKAGESLPTKAFGRYGTAYVNPMDVLREQRGRMPDQFRQDYRAEQEGFDDTIFAGNIPTGQFGSMDKEKIKPYAENAFSRAAELGSEIERMRSGGEITDAGQLRMLQGKMGERMKALAEAEAAYAEMDKRDRQRAGGGDPELQAEMRARREEIADKRLKLKTEMFDVRGKVLGNSRSVVQARGQSYETIASSISNQQEMGQISAPEAFAARLRTNQSRAANLNEEIKVMQEQQKLEMARGNNTEAERLRAEIITKIAEKEKIVLEIQQDQKKVTEELYGIQEKNLSLQESLAAAQTEGLSLAVKQLEIKGKEAAAAGMYIKALMDGSSRGKVGTAMFNDTVDAMKKMADYMADRYRKVVDLQKELNQLVTAYADVANNLALTDIGKFFADYNTAAGKASQAMTQLQIASLRAARDPLSFEVARLNLLKEMSAMTKARLDYEDRISQLSTRGRTASLIAVGDRAGSDRYTSLRKADNELDQEFRTLATTFQFLEERGVKSAAGVGTQVDKMTAGRNDMTYLTRAFESVMEETGNSPMRLGFNGMVGTSDAYGQMNAYLVNLAANSQQTVNAIERLADLELGLGSRKAGAKEQAEIDNLTSIIARGAPQLMPKSYFVGENNTIMERTTDAKGNFSTRKAEVPSVEGVQLYGDNSAQVDTSLMSIKAGQIQGVEADAKKVADALNMAQASRFKLGSTELAQLALIVRTRGEEIIKNQKTVELQELMISVTEKAIARARALREEEEHYRATLMKVYDLQVKRGEQYAAMSRRWGNVFGEAAGQEEARRAKLGQSEAKLQVLDFDREGVVKAIRDAQAEADRIKEKMAQPGINDYQRQMLKGDYDSAIEARDVGRSRLTEIDVDRAAIIQEMEAAMMEMNAIQEKLVELGRSFRDSFVDALKSGFSEMFRYVSQQDLRAFELRKIRFQEQQQDMYMPPSEAVQKIRQMRDMNEERIVMEREERLLKDPGFRFQEEMKRKVAEAPGQILTKAAGVGTDIFTGIAETAITDPAKLGEMWNIMTGSGDWNEKIQKLKAESGQLSPEELQKMASKQLLEASGKFKEAVAKAEVLQNALGPYTDKTRTAADSLAEAASKMHLAADRWLGMTPADAMKTKTLMGQELAKPGTTPAAPGTKPADAKAPAASGKTSTVAAWYKNVDATTPYARDINATANKHGVPPQLAASLIRQESGFNPKARSPVGAIGLGQLMPGTAKTLGVNPNNPQENLEGSMRYLRGLYDRTDKRKSEERRWKEAIAMYNAGPGWNRPSADPGHGHQMVWENPNNKGFAETREHNRRIFSTLPAPTPTPTPIPTTATNAAPGAAKPAAKTEAPKKLPAGTAPVAEEHHDHEEAKPTAPAKPKPKAVKPAGPKKRRPMPTDSKQMTDEELKLNVSNFHRYNDLKRFNDNFGVKMEEFDPQVNYWYSQPGEKGMRRIGWDGKPVPEKKETPKLPLAEQPTTVRENPQPLPEVRTYEKAMPLIQDTPDAGLQVVSSVKNTASRRVTAPVLPRPILPAPNKSLAPTPPVPAPAPSAQPKVATERRPAVGGTVAPVKPIPVINMTYLGKSRDEVLKDGSWKHIPKAELPKWGITRDGKPTEPKSDTPVIDMRWYKQPRELIVKNGWWKSMSQSERAQYGITPDGKLMNDEQIDHEVDNRSAWRRHREDREHFGNPTAPYNPEFDYAKMKFGDKRLSADYKPAIKAAPKNKGRLPAAPRFVARPTAAASAKPATHAPATPAPVLPTPAPSKAAPVKPVVPAPSPSIFSIDEETKDVAVNKGGLGTFSSPLSTFSPAKPVETIPTLFSPTPKAPIANAAVRFQQLVTETPATDLAGVNGGTDNNSRLNSAFSNLLLTGQTPKAEETAVDKKDRESAKDQNKAGVEVAPVDASQLTAGEKAIVDRLDALLQAYDAQVEEIAKDENKMGRITELLSSAGKLPASLTPEAKQEEAKNWLKQQGHNAINKYGNDILNGMGDKVGLDKNVGGLEAQILDKVVSGIPGGKEVLGKFAEGGASGAAGFLGTAGAGMGVGTMAGMGANMFGDAFMTKGQGERERAARSSGGNTGAMIGSAAGVGLGALLTATGVGAVAGIPMMIAGGALGGMAGAGIGRSGNTADARALDQAEDEQALRMRKTQEDAINMMRLQVEAQQRNTTAIQMAGMTFSQVGDVISRDIKLLSSASDIAGFSVDQRLQGMSQTMAAPESTPAQQAGPGFVGSPATYGGSADAGSGSSVYSLNPVDKSAAIPSLSFGINTSDGFATMPSAPAAISPVQMAGANAPITAEAFKNFREKPRFFAEGGWVPGSGSGDTVPAMLTPGEYVLTQEETKKAMEAGIIGNNGGGFWEGITGWFKNLWGGIIGNNGSGVVSNNGGNVVSNNGGNIVANNTARVVSNNGGNVIGNNGANILSNNGAGIIGGNTAGFVQHFADGGMVQSSNWWDGLLGGVSSWWGGLFGGNVVSNNGANIISDQGGSVVSNNGGNIVANNTARVVSNNGGNVISNNGANLIGELANGVVANNGARLIGNNGAGILSNNGGNLIGNNGAGIISDQGGSFWGAAQHFAQGGMVRDYNPGRISGYNAGMPNSVQQMRAIEVAYQGMDPSKIIADGLTQPINVVYNTQDRLDLPPMEQQVNLKYGGGSGVNKGFGGDLMNKAKHRGIN